MYNRIIHSPQSSQKRKLRKLCDDLALISSEYDYVTELNRILTRQYDTLISLLPTPAEIDFLIEELRESFYYHEDINDRINELKKLRRISKQAMSGQKIRISSYDEQVKRYRNINK